MDRTEHFADAFIIFSSQPPCLIAFPKAPPNWQQMDLEKRKQLLAEFDRIMPSLISPEDPRSEQDLALFCQLYGQFLEEPCKVNWSDIRPMPAEQQLPHEQLPRVEDEQERMALLKRLVVIKLNGGLGTTMGCRGPKSLVELREGHNFLDFALGQHKILNGKHGADVPLLLMNSFNTDAQTKQYLANASVATLSRVQCFCQSRCPRIFADSLLPVPQGWDDCPEEGWYPPGHGNIFSALAQSGLLDELLAQGRDIAFVANIDNTGAVFDDSIAKVIADGNADYIMEMTPRTAADVKGGTLVEVNNGQRLMHLECPQVPDERIEEFCSLETFKIFNTNNIWLNLAAARQCLSTMKMEILANKKRLPSGRDVIQLEQSIGGAIRNFPGRALAVCVPRSRFLPVKSTNDLLRMRSACLFEFLTSECQLQQRLPLLPMVKLSTEFSALHDFERRIPEIPVLLDVQKIILEGDIWLGKGIKMRGIVELRTKPGQCLRVPDNSIIGEIEEANKEEEKLLQQK